MGNPEEDEKLTFIPATKTADFQAIYDYNLDAFSDTPDFNWTLDEIKREVKEGWELYAVKKEKEIVAAVFLKKEGKHLLSKNTAVKMSHKGSGYSHQIKEWIEDYAYANKLIKIFHFCRIDNFRMYSLNESHGYEKTDRKVDDDGQVVEWQKVLK